MKRSASKENINKTIPKSYQDLTSPLVNFAAVKEKNIIRSSLKNNVLLKMQMY
jgi:hypothetical protein